ncbi:WAT1-related protein At1g43650-like isoform X2 [Telopea speciosissima]|uniref:WAT1-related protein At1g43650-like isoform X2 n=1 Tax=Telopea speciosissima TaxID=54955 RepID=UPI001CC5B232|nr:WAT1-related protein At1g43650-like isoform X2 [Telopea speciosissima]
MGTLSTFGSYMAMVVVQFGYGGATILMKIALNKGPSQLVFIVYRHLIAMLLLGPLAYFLERKQRPSLSIPIMIKVFFLSTFGTTICLNVFYAGLNYTSPTVASALGNVTPGFTFVMALLLRLEKLRIKSAKGRAKVYGTLICIGGAMVFIFWKGGYHFKSLTRSPLIDIDGTSGSVHGSIRHHKEDWIKGSLLILISFIAWSAWLILQSLVSDVYPAPLSLNTLVCFFASLQSSVLALFLDRKPTSWRVEWNVQLLIIIYSGIVNSALGYYLQTWCIKEKGPVFAAMFFPLQLVIVGIFSAIVFAERLHLGSLIGAFLIVVGLYTVLWGKSTNSYSEGKVGNDDKSSLDDHQTLEISLANQPLCLTIPTTTEKN